MMVLHFEPIGLTASVARNNVSLASPSMLLIFLENCLAKQIVVSAVATSELNALGIKQEGRGIDDSNKMLGVVGIIDGMVMCGTDLVAMLSMVSMVLVLGVGKGVVSCWWDCLVGEGMQQWLLGMKLDGAGRCR